MKRLHATISATRDAIDHATRYATRYANYTGVPNHPTSDHITALLERAKEVAR